MAYVAIIIRARLSGIGQHLEEAAQDLGGKPFRVLLDITLPLLAPALIAGWLLAFTLSLDDLVIASFVSGPGSNTLPMLIYSRVRLGLRPDINALATIIILVVAIGVFIAGWLLLRQQQQRDRDLQIAGTGDTSVSPCNDKNHHSRDQSGDIHRHQVDMGTPERPGHR